MSRRTSRKRVIGVAAVVASFGLSAMTVNAGLAYSDPTPCPGCHGGPGGPGGGGSPAPQHPASTQAPQTTEAPSPHSTAPQTTAAPSTQQTTAAPSTQQTTTAEPSTHTTTAEPSTNTTSPAGTQTTPQPSTQTTPAGTQTTTPPTQTTPAGSQTTSLTRPGVTATVVLNPPSTQPPHPPFIPRGNLITASAEVGGPVDVTLGFSVPGRGAPPAPREHGFGWNDGPAPHHAPPNWQGPPPPGGWDGPAPEGGWNRPWDGPRDRDIARARGDFGPFAYNTFTVLPVFNWYYGGWGYWFFGVWVPLY